MFLGQPRALNWFVKVSTGTNILLSYEKITSPSISRYFDNSVFEITITLLSLYKCMLMARFEYHE